MDPVTLALTFLLSFLVSGNNLSVCVGGAVGSRAISYRYALLLSTLGYVSGLLVEGHKMSLVNNDATPVLLTSVLIFALGEAMRIPTSLTGSLYMAIVGSGWVHGSVPGNILIVLIYWLTAPLITVVLAFVAYRLMSRSMEPRHVPIRALTVATVPLLSYSFGANNLGLIWSTVGFTWLGLVVVIAGSVLGTLLMGWRTLYRLTGLFTIGPLTGFITQLLAFLALEVGTQFSAPFPITVATVFGLVGIGMAHGFRIINPRYAGIIILGFLTSIALGIILGYLIAEASLSLGID
jgi:PiT family inorganic phosphate transporter